MSGHRGVDQVIGHDAGVIRRHAVSDEENLVGVYAVGAPVRDASGATVAAISGALPRHGVTKADLPRLSRLVRSAAERISARLGAPVRGGRGT